ncbi:hypothetical protein ACWFOS_16270 [Gordonia terrae]
MTRSTSRTVHRPARAPARTAAAPPTPENSPMTPAQRTRYAIAVHEAGHAIMATILGETVGSVTITPETRPTPGT